MKQKFFSLLALLVFLALGNQAFAQSGLQTATKGSKYMFKEDASGLGGGISGSFMIERTGPTRDMKYIGTGNVNGCDGYIMLPDGVAHISKAEYIVFKCNDGSGETKIDTRDLDARAVGVQTKANGDDATLIKN